MRSTILHLDLDAFFASVEQLKNPRLRGKPVIVGNGVIASCSYEARRYGLYAGMPLVQALRLCPHAIVRDGDQTTYRCFTDAIWKISNEYLPALDTYLDEAYGDLTGTEKLLGHPHAVGRVLKQRIQTEVGLPVTIGIGSNRMIAKMAGQSVKPDGLAFIPWGEEEAFLADRPIEELPGVGPVTARMFHEMGLRTVPELRSLSLEALEGMLGRMGVHLYERCRGRDTRPVREREIPVTISRETALGKPTSDPAEARGFLQYLLERGMTAARHLGLRVGTVKVKLEYEDSHVDEASRTLDAPTMVDSRVLDAIDALLKTAWTRRVNFRRLGVVLSRFVPEDPQPELFDLRRDARKERLCHALDEIRTKFGHASLIAGASIALLRRLKQDAAGFVLRTPSLTK